MLLIFGWEPRFHHLGPTREKTCPRCGNKRYWILQRERNYITLFFIPLIPLRTRFREYCPVCEHGEVLSSADAQDLQRLARIQEQAIREDWEEERFREALREAGLEQFSAEGS